LQKKLLKFRNLKENIYFCNSIRKTELTKESKIQSYG